MDTMTDWKKYEKPDGMTLFVQTVGPLDQGWAISFGFTAAVHRNGDWRFDGASVDISPRKHLRDSMESLRIAEEKFGHILRERLTGLCESLDDGKAIDPEGVYKDDIAALSALL